jgi:hypothetical protein
MRNPLFKGTLTHPTTKYVGCPIHDGVIGGHIAWKDATSSATITLEMTSFGPDLAPNDEAGAAWEWKDSGVSITGPAGAAAGSVLVNVENARQLRARYKIVTAATCDLEIYDGAKP